MGGHLVLDGPQGGEGGHRRVQAGGGQARQLVRQHGHLLLGGEDDLDPEGRGSLEHGVEPGEGVGPERGDPHQVAHVPGEAGQAERVAHGHQDVVAELVEPGGDLPGRQSRALGEQDPHGLKYIR